MVFLRLSTFVFWGSLLGLGLIVLDNSLCLSAGVPEDDESKHARIKTNVTSHLKMCIKALQNEYVISDTPIHRYCVFLRLMVVIV